MSLDGVKVGFALSGSYCTFEQVIPQMIKLVEAGASIVPIMSANAQTTDTRFGKAKDHIDMIENISGRSIVRTITEAEPLGPQGAMDILIVAPCTGNSLAKLANAITDTPVLMAAKGHLRNEKPLVLAIATNDALGLNMKNLGILMSTKNIFFVPMGQDNYKKKPNSIVADMDQILPTLEAALEHKQLQPVLISYKQ